jgi:hypothetical protein
MQDCFLTRLSFVFLVGIPLLTERLASDAPGQTPIRGKPLSIGLRKQLLVDDYVVEKRFNVARKLGQVTKANGGKPVLEPEKPWEDPHGFCCYGTVLHDGKNFRLWYRCFSGGVAYAESDDGVHWRKPNLGLYDFDFNKVRRQGAFQLTEKPKQAYAGRDNNIIGFLGDAWCCFLDPHETDLAHKFKAAHYPLPENATHYGAALSHSPDGFRWTPYNQGKPVTGRACDCYNQILWDEDAKTHRLYTRQDYGQAGFRKLGAVEEIRGGRSMTNRDVKADPTNWTTVRQWKFDREGPDEHKRRQLMAMTNWIYEGVHFGMMVVYEWPEDFSEGPYDLHKRHERDILNLYIAPCRGGDQWDLSWVYAGRPLISRGPDGSFDKDFVWHISNIVTHKDRHWIFYTGSNERHWPGGERWKEFPCQLAMGLATLRLDGFVCLEAKEEPGTVLTKPFKLEGTKLEVNVDAKQGQVLVEVLGDDGQPISGFSQSEAEAQPVDEIRLRPRWREQRDLTSLKGKVVQLRFRLKNARLYAFQIVP